MTSILDFKLLLLSVSCCSWWCCQLCLYAPSYYDSCFYKTDPQKIFLNEIVPFFHYFTMYKGTLKYLFKSMKKLWNFKLDFIVLVFVLWFCWFSSELHRMWTRCILWLFFPPPNWSMNLQEKYLFKMNQRKKHKPSKKILNSVKKNFNLPYLSIHHNKDKQKSDKASLSLFCCVLSQLSSF